MYHTHKCLRVHGRVYACVLMCVRPCGCYMCVCVCVCVCALCDMSSLCLRVRRCVCVHVGENTREKNHLQAGWLTGVSAGVIVRKLLVASSRSP